MGGRSATFNSLFEMLIDIVIEAQALIELSILYLRCPQPAEASGALPAYVLSILYLRCPQRRLGARVETS